MKSKLALSTSSTVSVCPYFYWSMDFESARSMILRLFTSKDVDAQKLFEELPGFRHYFVLL